MSELLNRVCDVNMNDFGTFKYILIKVYDDANNASKIVIRGDFEFSRHADIFRKFTRYLPPTLRAVCMGGGYIECNTNERMMRLFGYSERYGPADKDACIELLSKQWHGYTFIRIDEDT